MQAIFRLFARSFPRQWVLWFFVGLIILLVGLTYQGRLSGDTRLIASGLAFVIFAALALIQSYSEWLRPHGWPGICAPTSSLANPADDDECRIPGRRSAWSCSVDAPRPPYIRPLPAYLLLWFCTGFMAFTGTCTASIPRPACTLCDSLPGCGTTLDAFSNSQRFSIHPICGQIASFLLWIYSDRSICPSANARSAFLPGRTGSGLLAFLGVVLLLRRRDIAHLSDPDA